MLSAAFVPVNAHFVYCLLVHVHFNILKLDHICAFPMLLATFSKGNILGLYMCIAHFSS